MSWKLYLISILAAIGGGFLLGWTQNKEKVVTQVEEKAVVVWKEQEVLEVTKWKEKIVTVEKIVRPDGTIEERIIEQEKEMQEEFQKKEKEIAQLKEKLNKKETVPVLSSYSLGLQVPLKFSEETPISYLDSAVVLGARVLGPFWIEGSFQHSTREVTIGVRYEL